MDPGPRFKEQPKPPPGPPNTVERDSNLVGAALAIGTAVLLLILLACSARIGPHDDGWLSWDVCGYEGGVAVEITVMQAGARLGCTNPDEGNGTVDEQLEPPPEEEPE